MTRRRQVTGTVLPRGGTTGADDSPDQDSEDVPREVVMSAAERARRWRRILAELRPELPGEWSIRGTGVGTLLVREPFDWSLAWIGYDGSPSRPAGWLSAGVQPLVTADAGRVMTYGIRMDEVRSGPRTVDLLSDEAADHVRRFVLDSGLPVLDRWPAERLAEVAERDFAQAPDRRRTHWHQAPGWRVVTGTASPVEPARELAALCRVGSAPRSAAGARHRAARIAFYEGLDQAWQQGGRAEALRFLTGWRDRVLTERKLDRVSAGQVAPPAGAGLSDLGS
ncbi:hypothetical protein [Plantactinospora sp. B5E13]|uniref:hypothetical protein n=1 Tax=Plantactinospora sp. B5E13 TaxID=3153758 RepID=UPI00325F8533